MIYLLCALILASCQMPLDAPTEMQMYEDKIEATWIPEPLTVYIFEVETIPCPENIIKQYSTIADKYPAMLKAAKQTVDIHNRDYDPDWYYVGGGL